MHLCDLFDYIFAIQFKLFWVGLIVCVACLLSIFKTKTNLKLYRIHGKESKEEITNVDDAEIEVSFTTPTKKSNKLQCKTYFFLNCI